MKPHRRQPLYLAFLLHRISGLALALFLPFHFHALALVLTDPQQMDDFLHWNQIPMVKASEVVLIFLLAVHLFGGLRLLALENMSPEWRKKEEDIPLARIGQPEEIAGMAVFLAGPEATFVTGQGFGVNGGSVMP